MKKKTTKLLLTSSCALAFSLALASGVALSVEKVSADTATLQSQTQSFAITDGASVRLSDPYGIRYTASIGKTEYENLAKNYASVEYGVLICPTDLLTGKTLDFDESDGLVAGNAVEGQVEFGYVTAQPVYKAETDSYEFKGALVGIKENNLSRPFTGRAYIKTTDTNGAVDYVYTGEISRSIYTVATYAVNDPDEEVKEKLDAVVEGVAETARTYLNGVIDKVHTVYGTPTVSVVSSNAETEDYNILNDGDKVTVTATVQREVNGEVRILPACPAVSAVESSGITLEQVSPTEYIVRGINKSGYNLNASLAGETLSVFENNVQSWEREITAEHWKGAWESGLSLVKQTEGNYAGAYKWEGVNNIDINENTFGNLEKGDRVQFDICAPNGIYLYTKINDSEDFWAYLTKESSGTVNNAFSYRFMDANGDLLGKDLQSCQNEWVTVEITLGEIVNQYFYLMIYPTLFDGNVYLRNMKLYKYGTDVQSVTLEGGATIDTTKTYDFLTPINVGSLEVTDMRGVTKSYPATAEGAYVENGVLYTGLGEQTVVIKAQGFTEGLEYTIKGASSGTILDGQETLSNIKTGENFKMTYESKHEGNANVWIVGNNGVENDYNDPMHDYNGDGIKEWHEPSDGFTFTDKISNYIEKDKGLYLDVQLFVPTACNLTAYYHNEYYSLYSEPSNGWWSYYKADGTKVTSGFPLANLGSEPVCTGEWITLRINVVENWNNATDSISVVNDQFYDWQGIRFGKITLTTSADAPTIELS